VFEIRDLQLLSALARHRHFAKAAEECGISQPAFSMRIRNLEDRLGVSIVRRANRFQGLTEEGEMIVRRARRILDDAKALEQEVQAIKGEITGTLILGVIPTAIAFTGRLVKRLQQAHPRNPVADRDDVGLGNPAPSGRRQPGCGDHLWRQHRY